MASFIEFYVGCNPPLLPTGVAFVVETTTLSLPPGYIIEMLYEPEMPWFKIISEVSHQADITSAIQQVLTEVGEAETGLINVDNRRIDSVLDQEPEPDVSIIAEEPRITPWSVYDDTKELEAQAYDDFRFPETMGTGRIRAVWRGLENGPGLKLNQMMSALSTIWPSLVDQPVDEFFRRSFHCVIATNLREDRVYIQCKDSYALDDALHYLNIMLRVASSLAAQVYHMVYTTTEPFKFTLRSLTSVGLARKTYVSQISSPTKSQGHDVNTLAALRVICLNEENEWVFDTNTYVSTREDERGSGDYKSFSALAKVNFTPKQPAIRVRLPPTSTKQEQPATEQEQPSLLDDPIPDEFRLRFSSVLGENNKENGAANDDGHGLFGIQSLLDVFEKHTSSTPSNHEEDLIVFDDDLYAASICQGAPLQSAGSLPIEIEEDSESLPGTACDVNPFFEPYEIAMREAAQVLEIAPGFLALELQLGRCYFDGLSSDILAGQISLQLEDATKLLSQLPFGFSPILTTRGQEADMLHKTIVCGIRRWKQWTTTSVFVFGCAIGSSEFVVEVDTTDFTYTCKTPEQNLTSLYIHAPLHAWDMKFCARQSRNLGISEGGDNHDPTGFGGDSLDIEGKNAPLEFAKTMVASLGVSMDEAGVLTLRVIEDVTLTGAIDTIHIKQTVRYKTDPEGDCILNITRYQVLCKELSSSPHEVIFKNTNPGRRRDAPPPSTPEAWFEASLTSSRCEELLARHRDLLDGECGPGDGEWSCDDLKSDGVFRAFCLAGFDIVTQMDKVGLTNDNGAGRDETPWPGRSVAGIDEPVREKPAKPNVNFEFW